MNRSAIPTISPAAHVPHVLHRDARAWSESNCYVDLWIELLHSLGLEPHALLAHTLSVDFEGDQWTFFKPWAGDLWALYGIQLEELQIFDVFGEHVSEQLARGRVVLAETDAFHLPDTAGTTYRTEHAKTTIAIERADEARRRLGYFHNGGYWIAEGDDHDALMNPSLPLPPYVEIVKLDRAVRLEEGELRRRAIELLIREVARRPQSNPLRAHVEHFGEHASKLGDLESFHRYAFATLRQCGAAFELAARFLRWLEPGALGSAANELDAIALAAKAALLKLARAVQRGKPPDVDALAEAAPRYGQAFSTIEHWLRARGEAA